MGTKLVTKRLSPDDTVRIVAMQESWSVDKKDKRIKPSRLSKTISAFANSAGGEIYLGISHGCDKTDYCWDGFDPEEEMNPFLAVLDELMPSFDGYSIEGLVSDTQPSMVLHITVHKTQQIIYATDGKAYTRQGVQNLPCDNDTKLLKLRMEKGIASFEDEITRGVFDEIKESRILEEFVQQVVPQTSKYDWLRSQRLMNESARITVAGVLLYDECPQAILPKHSAVRITRYHTDDSEGTRDTLTQGYPISVEGDIYSLIKKSVEKVCEIVESTDVVGTQEIESKKYPEIALHEIITNAVLHRDYSIPKDIQVRIFTNRVEIESPGRLPGHVTVENILQEQFSRNPKVVRLISKFPVPPNKDVGEGLNTAFEAMVSMQLQRPQIRETDHSVLVIIKHERLADAETLVLEYMSVNESISNSEARALTGISDANKMKRVFNRLKAQGKLEIVPGTRSSATRWQRTPAGTMEKEKPSSPEQMKLFI